MAKLSEREWTVLSALWDSGGATLGALTEALREETGWSRNTVLTYLTRMEAKGLVVIDKEGYPRLYRAGLDKAACQAQARDSFLRQVYQGGCRGSGGGVFAGKTHLLPGAGGTAPPAGRDGGVAGERHLVLSSANPDGLRGGGFAAGGKGHVPG